MTTHKAFSRAMYAMAQAFSPTPIPPRDSTRANRAPSADTQSKNVLIRHHCDISPNYRTKPSEPIPLFCRISTSGRIDSSNTGMYLANWQYLTVINNGLN